MKKLFNLFAAMMLATLFGGIVIPSAEANELRIATQPSPFCAPIFIAKHKGWVDEELARAGTKPSIKWTGFAAGPMPHPP